MSQYPQRDTQSNIVGGRSGVNPFGLILRYLGSQGHLGSDRTLGHVEPGGPMDPNAGTVDTTPQPQSNNIMDLAYQFLKEAGLLDGMDQSGDQQPGGGISPSGFGEEEWFRIANGLANILASSQENVGDRTFQTQPPSQLGGWGALQQDMAQTDVATDPSRYYTPFRYNPGADLWHQKVLGQAGIDTSQLDMDQFKRPPYSNEPPATYPSPLGG